MIISDQGSTAVSIRTYNADGFYLRFIQRQHAVIFQKNASLSCYIQSFFYMFFTFHFLIRDLVIFAALKKSQEIPCGKGSFC